MKDLASIFQISHNSRFIGCVKFRVVRYTDSTGNIDRQVRPLGQEIGYVQLYVQDLLYVHTGMGLEDTRELLAVPSAVLWGSQVAAPARRIIVFPKRFLIIVGFLR